MSVAYIGVGSNIDPEKNIEGAINYLNEEATVLEVSSFYKTAPIDESGIVDNDKPDFYNGVFKVEVFFEPFTLKSYLRHVEKELGRIRGDGNDGGNDASKFAPRTIDLDILIYDNLIIDEPGLTLPDGDIWKREFVATPLLELMGDDTVLPGDGGELKTSLKSVADGLKSDKMAYLGDFTGRLKALIKNI